MLSHHMLWLIRDIPKQCGIPIRLATIQVLNSLLSQTVGKQASLLLCCWWEYKQNTSHKGKLAMFIIIIDLFTLTQHLPFWKAVPVLY